MLNLYVDTYIIHRQSRDSNLMFEQSGKVVIAEEYTEFALLHVTG